MPSTLGPMIGILLSCAFSTVGWAQSREAPLAVEELPCSFCHTCDKPTRTQPCLRRCPRTSAAAVAKAMGGMHGPDVVILNELENLYLPVPFDHKGHAQMAEMTEACGVCHHYTPEGTAHPACKHCHDIAPKRENIRKPSLKAAYHRQCMSCHREWSHETGCAVCHPPKVGTDGTLGSTPMPTKDDIVGQMHPPIPEPHTEIYQPRSKPKPGEKVIFRHKEHTQRFGLKCAECHREESCSRCHEVGRTHQQRERTPAEHHRPCSTCHDVSNKNACDRCHWKEGEAKPKPFDHADLGWELSAHHAQLGCRTCHEAVPFQKLDRECNTCHGDWAPDSFDHRVTGQMLDANHEDVACEDCHAERKFDRPPKCDECHDVDDGITFPARRPGPLVIPFHHVGERYSDD
jgi:hypothetical protein